MLKNIRPTVLKTMYRNLEFLRLHEQIKKENPRKHRLKFFKGHITTESKAISNWKAVEVSAKWTQHFYKEYPKGPLPPDHPQDTENMRTERKPRNEILNSRSKIKHYNEY